MTPTPNPKDPALTSLAHDVRLAMRGWLHDADAHAKLSGVLPKLSTADLKRIRRFLGRRLPRPPIPKSLKDMLQVYRRERRQREKLLDLVEAAAPSMAMRRRVAKLRQAMAYPGARLTAAQLKAVLKDQDSLARYLSTLSVVQIEGMKEAIRNGIVRLPAKAKKLFLRLFQKLQQEQFLRECDWMQNVGPLARGVFTAVAIQARITRLERIQRSL